MSAVPVIEHEPIATPEPVTYKATCSVCDESFDALRAKWCSCIAPMRTLACPHCSSCFCHAPVMYKRRFWSNAPMQLRQDIRRFHVQLKTEVLASAHSYPPHTRRPVVLIVDDDESMKSLVACYVQQLGYRTLTASDPIEGLDVIDTRHVDLVITDALMPKMDGREMCRRIKSTRDGALKKVIVMTSLYKTRTYETEAIHRFGADALLKKPLDLKALAKLLETFAPIRA